jgi:hypothetical protein
MRFRYNAVMTQKRDHGSSGRPPPLLIRLSAPALLPIPALPRAVPLERKGRQIQALNRRVLRHANRPAIDPGVQKKGRAPASREEDRRGACRQVPTADGASAILPRRDSLIGRAARAAPDRGWKSPAARRAATRWRDPGRPNALRARPPGGTVPNVITHFGILSQGLKAMREACRDVQFARLSALSSTPTHRPRDCDAGRRSTATSKTVPRVHETSLASSCGGTWKCSPRSVPRRRLKEVLHCG